MQLHWKVELASAKLHALARTLAGFWGLFEQQMLLALFNLYTSAFLDGEDAGAGQQGCATSGGCQFMNDIAKPIPLLVFLG